MALKLACKKCKTKIDSKATVCPECGTKYPFNTVGSAIFTTVFMVVIFASVFYACTPEEKTPEQLEKEAAAKIERDCRNEINAFVMSQTFVKRNLKSPSSAKFPYIGADGVSIKYLGDCTNLVIAYVDSQNSFGAMIRTKYAAEIKYNPDSEAYDLLDFGME